MRKVETVWVVGGVLLLAAVVCAFQRPFRQYPSFEYGWAPLPPNWHHQKAEFTFARLMYPPVPTTATAGGSMETGG